MSKDRSVKSYKATSTYSVCKVYESLSPNKLKVFLFECKLDFNWLKFDSGEQNHLASQGERVHMLPNWQPGNIHKGTCGYSGKDSSI